MRSSFARKAAGFLLIAFTARGLHGQSPAEHVVTAFVGYRVTLFKPALDEFGVAETTAEVCFDLREKHQCYRFADGGLPPIGFDPQLTPVTLGKAGSALLFSATQYAGGSGGTTHFAIIRPGNGAGVDDSLLPGGLTLSMQSEHTFWTDPGISNAPIFVTADYVWGLGECHTCEHRFTVSAYLLKPPVAGFNEDYSYNREDQYMTVRRYLNGVINPEKPEILARLKRVKAEEERRARAPH